MKIVTWNINGIRAVVQKGFHDFIAKEKPDLLCLQETKAHPDQLEEQITAPKGYTSYWAAAQRPGYSGTATYTKSKPKEVQYGFGIPKFDAEGRMVVATFPKFTLFNVYFPNGGSGMERHLYKQEFLKRFAHHLVKRARNGENIIVVGDYNVAYLDHDVYNPIALSAESGFLPEEREWMTQFLENGFIDGFRYFHPKEKDRYTWWSYFQNARTLNKGWRIDHICVSRSLEKKLKSVEILDDVTGSDHCPVIAEIDL